MLSVLKNGSCWDFSHQEESPNTSYHQPKDCSKVDWKTSMTDIAHQLAISTSTVIRKLNDFHFKHDFSRLREIMFWDVETVREVTVSIGRCRWVSLRKILTISISSLFLRTEHKLSFEITFLNMIEPSDVEWKSLLWICLVLIIPCLNSFAFEFLGSGWNSLPDCFTPECKNRSGSLSPFLIIFLNSG